MTLTTTVICDDFNGSDDFVKCDDSRGIVIEVLPRWVTVSKLRGQPIAGRTNVPMRASMGKKSFQCPARRPKDTDT